MQTDAPYDHTIEQPTFRPSRNLFIVYLVVGALSLILLIGIPIIIAAFLWYKFTYITLGKQGLHMHKGWLNVIDKQVPYEKINTIETQQSILDRMFGTGQLKIFTGNDLQGIVFMGIDQPQYVKQLIEQRTAQAVHTATTNMVQPQQTSAADELAKYAALRDKGIISSDEFDTKKRQLLG